ncbi:MAG: FMN-binding protein [Spirochaetales bacterium]|nr:FMN-binding protein [Spirochaetales bacterium]
MKKPVLIIMAVLLSMTPLFAKKYDNLKTSLTKVLPAGEQVYKTSLKLTQEQAEQLNEVGGSDFWKGDSFDIYYTKKADGTLDTAAVEIMEILEAYQSIHTWVIGIKADGTRTGLAVRELSDHYSYPLAEENFTSRFPTREGQRNGTEPSSIDTVSGATMSSDLLKASVERVMLVLEMAGLR